MKARLLGRLERMAAVREACLIDSIRGHTATLQQQQAHLALLDAYRERLGDTWRAGDPVPAAQARRAVQFAQASLGAAAQIAQAAAAAAAQLEAALEALAQAKAQHRGLTQALIDAARTAERAVEQAAERDRAGRPIPDRQAQADASSPQET